MKVQDRNKRIAECLNELQLSQKAYFMQLMDIASKYSDIPNIAEKMRRAFAIEGNEEMIADCISEYRKVHDDFFPRGKPLEDAQWEECIKQMDEITAKYKREIPTIAGSIAMAFLDDIEEYHKKWIDHLKKTKGE